MLLAGLIRDEIKSIEVAAKTSDKPTVMVQLLQAALDDVEERTGAPL